MGEREEETESDKGCQGMLGAVAPSVAKTILFHLSSAAHAIHMQTSAGPPSLLGLTPLLRI